MKKVLIGLGALVVIAVVAVVALVTLAPEKVLEMGVRSERSNAGVERREIDTARGPIVYLDGGSGPVLVLLHGFGADKDNWTRVAKHLTGSYRVVAPDLPGFGESPRDPEADHSIPSQVENVRAFVEALGIERFHLGGNSMGGNISGSYAAKYPDQVKSLWLLAPGGVASAEPSELAGLIEKGENPLLVESPEEFGRLMDFAMEERPWLPESLVTALGERAIRDRDFHDRIFEQIGENWTPLEEELAASRVPALILWGDHDRLLHVSGARILGDAMERAQVVIFEGCGHIPMVERPEASAETFLLFQEGLAAEARVTGERRRRAAGSGEDRGPRRG